MTDEELRIRFKEMFPIEANNEKFLKEATHLFKYLEKGLKKEGPLNEEELKRLYIELFYSLGRTYH